MFNFMHSTMPVSVFCWRKYTLHILMCLIHSYFLMLVTTASQWSSRFTQHLTWRYLSPFLSCTFQPSYMAIPWVFNVLLYKFFFSFMFGNWELSFFVSAVRAGAGGDEAGIWAGDLVGRWWFYSNWVQFSKWDIAIFHFVQIVEY